MLTGNLLPGWLSLMLAEGNCAASLRFGQENAPAVLRHFYIAEGRPALGIDGNRGSQINLRTLEAERPKLAPPMEEAWLPLLERALQTPVPGQIDVIGNLFRVVN